MQKRQYLDAEHKKALHEFFSGKAIDDCPEWAKRQYSTRKITPCVVLESSCSKS